VAGGGTSVTTFSAGTTGLTPNTATSGAVTLGGTLAVANGGTGSATQNFVDLTNTQSIGGAKTFTSAATFSSSVTANGTMQLANDGTYGSNYKMLAFTGNTNGTHRIFAGTGDNLYIAAATGRGIVLWTDGNTASKVSIDLDGQTTFISSVTATTGKFTAVGAGTFSNNLNITSDGTFTTATSDEKFKYNIRPLNYGLETLLQLKPVNFQWIEGEEEDLGFIAQDVAEIIPEAVNTNWNSDLLFRYESLIPILTKAIQEQNLLIKALEQRIINLENK
jgi:hypothetical protein